jgi:hypothetical protein
LGPAGPIDPQLQTLSAVGEDGKLLAVVVNFALHVDVIGGGGANFISADWPGVMAETISRVYGQDVVTMLAQGTCGDINHVPHDPTALPRSGPAKAEQIGRALAGAAMAALERAEPMKDGRLAVLEKTLEMPYYTRDAAFMAEIAALKAKPELSDFEKYIVERGEKWPYDNKTAQVPVQVMRIGEIGLVALPAEIFVPIGLEKRVVDDIRELAEELNAADASGPRLLPLPGTVYTELDAIEQLTGAMARLVAAGGIYGAEGSVWISVRGSSQQEQAAADLIQSVAGEPACKV